MCKKKLSEITITGIEFEKDFFVCYEPNDIIRIICLQLVGLLVVPGYQIIYGKLEVENLLVHCNFLYALVFGNTVLSPFE